MSIDWTFIGWSLLLILVAVAGAVGVVFLLRLARVKLGAENYNMLVKWAKELVAWAEQKGGVAGWSNEQKRTWVETRLLDICKQWGIPVTVEVLDIVIEAAVYTLKKLDEVLED